MNLWTDNVRMENGTNRPLHKQPIRFDIVQAEQAEIPDSEGYDVSVLH